jgi:hypothetical protein
MAQYLSRYRSSSLGGDPVGESVGYDQGEGEEKREQCPELKRPLRTKPPMASLVYEVNSSNTLR